MESVIKPTREKVNGLWHSVHYDRNVRIDMGPDDQLPNHDGKTFFRPVCVEHFIPGAGLYSYDRYCGKCHGRMGRYGDKCCPKCGAKIAHYIFAMGTVKCIRVSMPDYLTAAMKRNIPSTRRASQAYSNNPKAAKSWKEKSWR